MRVKHAPRLPPRGFFCLKLDQPQIRPHPYRRVALAECFAGIQKFLKKIGWPNAGERKRELDVNYDALLLVNFYEI
jgi:hypothetical protein